MSHLGPIPVLKDLLIQPPNPLDTHLNVVH